MGSVLKLLCQILTYLMIVIQVVCIVCSISVPGRSPWFADTQAYTCRMYLLSHYLLLVIRYNHSDVTAALEDTISTAFSTWLDTFHSWTFVNKTLDTRNSSMSAPSLCSALAIADSNTFFTSAALFFGLYARSSRAFSTCIPRI